VRTRNARLLLLAVVGASETVVSISPGLMLFDMYLTSIKGKVKFRVAGTKKAGKTMCRRFF
jgi:hypothetical protein